MIKTFKLDVTAKADSDFPKIMDSVKRLIKHVTPADLEILSKAIEKNPGVVQTAKTFL